MPKRYGQPCPVAKSLELLGERWTLLVIRDLLSGPRRFQDLLASLEGIAPNVLSERLKVLETHGIVAREFLAGGTSARSSARWPCGGRATSTRTPRSCTTIATRRWT